jgi:large subunit ribosomal protein L2
MRRKGGGAKRLYRIVDFKRKKMDVSATVERIEYDPNRTAFIALIKYEDGHQAYILAPQRLAVGDKVISSAKADVKPGNTIPFIGLPIGTIVHNIELKQGKGGQIARSAGTYAQFVGRDGSYAQVRLSSGELRLIRQECMATVGAVSNPDNSNQNFGKAGRNHHKGIRPSVRGVVMNPVDHPHGGGEGRTSGGRHPVTPWGKPTKGARTRSNKTTDKFIVRSRHAKKKGR